MEVDTGTMTLLPSLVPKLQRRGNERRILVFGVIENYFMIPTTQREVGKQTFASPIIKQLILH